MIVFCTLFDSNYLDKGLAMYRSLTKVAEPFRLYVLTMDDLCNQILDDYNYFNLRTIPVKHFVEETGLVEIEKTRKRGEFCWTCTPYLIDYIIKQYDEEQCTYLDSDLYFYSNPQCLLDEMDEKGKTVQIIEHRFNNNARGKIVRAESGTYCVQFNTFLRTEDSKMLLNWWKEKCFEDCSNINLKRTGVFGDQGYLETWGDKKNVLVTSNLGAGVAPWNLAQYKYVSMDDHGGIRIKHKKTKKEMPLVFYHFQDIEYYSINKVNIHIYDSWKADKELIQVIYNGYLSEVNEIKSELKERYDFFPLLSHHPGIKQISNRKRSWKILYKEDFDRLFPYRLYERTIGRIQKKFHTDENIFVISKDK